MNRGIVVFLFLLGLLLVLSATGLWMLGRQIPSALSQGLERDLRTKAQFEDLSLSLFAGKVQASAIRLTNQTADSWWRQAEATEMSVSFSWTDLWEGTVFADIDVQSAQVQLAAPSKSEASNSASLPGSVSGTTSWPRFQIRNIRIHHLKATLDASTSIAAVDLQTEVQQEGEGRWIGKIEGNSLTASGHSFSSCQMEFESSPDLQTIKRFELKSDDGILSGRAELPRSGSATLHIDLDKVPLDLLLSNRWQTVLVGKATGQIDYIGNPTDWKSGDAKGKIQLAEAELRSLPFLQKLALIPSLQSWTSVKLDRSEADFEYNQGSFYFPDFTFRKDGQFAWQGALKISSEGHLDGTTELGLSAGAINLIPGLSDKVFTKESESYRWANVHITGTADAPEEDLSPRLQALMQEEGKSLLKEGLNKASEILDSFLAPSSTKQ